VEEWLHPALRALHYAVLLGLFGMTAFPAACLRGLGGTPPANGMTTTAVAAPLVSAALALAGFSAMMGQPLAEMGWPVIWALLEATSIGWAFMWRSAMLVAALVFIRARPCVAAALYAAALMTLPWSGHAAASEGLPGLVHRLNDGVHLLAAGLWLGAIAWFVILTARVQSNPQAAAPLLAAMHGFAPVGVALVGIVAVTGVVNAHMIFGLTDTSAVLETTYGQLLAAKVLFVGLMLLAASRHAARARRSVLRRAGAGDAAAILTAARRTLTIELLFALAVISTVAALGLLSPMPR
jgi:putative copper resistance protein D